MLDALYFIGGYAVHGYHSVPPYQASHGCARVPLWAAHGDLPALEHRRHRLRPLMPSVLIVGAGFGGIAAAIELRRHGITDVRILEKADELRRDVVPQHLPRRRVRRPEPRLLVLVLPAARLGAAVPDAARHPALPARGRRRGGAGADHRDRDARERVPLGRGGAALDGRDQQGRADRGRADRRHGPAAPAGDAGAWRASSPATASTRPSGITATTCAASASRSSARARARCSSSRRSPSRPRTRRSSSARATGSCRGATAPTRAPTAALIERVPVVQRVRRAFLFGYLEALTLCIRHPRTFGHVLGAWSGAFMRRQLKDHPELREQVWPDYTIGCKRVLFSSTFLPDARPRRRRGGDGADRAPRARGDRHPRRARARGRLHHLRHRLPHHQLHVPDGDRGRRRALAARRCGAAARTPTSA